MIFTLSALHLRVMKTLCACKLYETIVVLVYLLQNRTVVVNFAQRDDLICCIA